MNLIARLAFEPTYINVTVQHVAFYINKTSLNFLSHGVPSEGILNLYIFNLKNLYSDYPMWLNGNDDETSEYFYITKIIKIIIKKC